MRRAAALFAALMVVSLSGWGASMKSIGKDAVNVRKAPKLDSEVLYETHIGYPIEIDKTQGDWVRFKDWQGTVGWVHKPLVSDVRTAVVVGDDVNVRKGPGSEHAVVKKVAKGEVYKVTGHKGEWVKIAYYIEGEEIGWVRKDMLWGSQ
ncbi:peptide-binding protein [Methylolobus aquaticus]|uniref:SH3 domain-containing protein n=1 Tax=Methylotetracoccus oryzae TaxID=1919059 RepID=UPI0010206F4B|nr:SH3 domain-containing protein [Methylotetracoccus oryzae]RYU57378.1 peptide-binding protein [Methylolobus aquaticus]